MMGSRGYDMTPTMYSPDGRIYQVEYAIETVKRGTLAVGIRGKDGVIVAVEEKPRALQTSSVTQKIFQVDHHIGVAAAGYIPDARIQVDNARTFSAGNRLNYDEDVEVETVAKYLADQCHQFTQYSGVRPYGVALIIAGVDQKGQSLYVTDPSGTFVPYSAVAIGAGSDDATMFLEEAYGAGMDMDDAAALAVAAISIKAQKDSGGDRMADTGNIKMARVSTQKRVLERIPDEELAGHAKAAGERFGRK